MKKIITILVVLVSFLSFSQKVKFKKEKVIIDDIETYIYEKEGLSITFSSLNSNEFITVLSTVYQERNPSYYSTPNPSKFGIRPMRDNYVYTVKFIQSGKELFTDLSDKEIIKAVYKYKLVDESGEIDDEKLNTFINKYNNENLKLKIN